MNLICETAIQTRAKMDTSARVLPDTARPQTTQPKTGRYLNFKIAVRISRFLNLPKRGFVSPPTCHRSPKHLVVVLPADCRFSPRHPRPTTPVRRHRGNGFAGEAQRQIYRRSPKRRAVGQRQRQAGRNEAGDAPSTRCVPLGRSHNFNISVEVCCAPLRAISQPQQIC